MLYRVLLFIIGLSAFIACSDAPPSSGASKADAPLAPSATANGADTPSTSTNAKPNGDNGSSSDDAAPLCKTGDKAGVAGDEDVTITSGGIDRVATIHVPASIDGIHPIPIVLVLHPLLLDREDMRKLANVESFADDKDHGFIAVYPDGIGRSWNAGECCGKAKDEQLDDVGFIQDLLKLVDSKWCVDHTRLFSMGFSNGSFLSHRLACQLNADYNLRAITAVSGTLGIPEGDCKPTHDTAVLAIHGTDDQLVPYTGGPPSIPLGESFGTFQAPTATDAFWAKNNACQAAASAPYYSKGEVSCVRHDGCRGAASVALCTVQGGGHQWPGGTELPAMGHLTTDIDATAAAMELFKARGL